VDEQNDQIAHHRIVAGREIPRNYGRNNNSPASGSSLSQSQLQLRMASLTGRSEEAYEAALRQALEGLTEVHQDAFSFV